MPTTALYARELRKKWKAAGLCSMCGVQPANRKGKVTCSDCAIRYSKYQRRLKKVALNGYGHKCFCCGETQFEFLSFDHVKNDGAAERRKFGKKMTAGSFYRMIVRQKFPKRYQLACHNCNLSLGFYGYCPHNPKYHRDTSKKVRP
jgi:hypothetical protein